jgi:hypothetical protein
MRVSKFIISACCGRSSTVFKTSRPIAVSDIAELVRLGFMESKNFTAAGLLYVDSSELTVSGPIGSDRLQVRCKKTKSDECAKAISDFEKVLTQLP